jgi:hypothetical protein
MHLIISPLTLAIAFVVGMGIGALVPLIVIDRAFHDEVTKGLDYLESRLDRLEGNVREPGTETHPRAPQTAIASD